MTILNFWSTPKLLLGRHGRDRMIVGYITTYVISAYHYYNVVSSNPAQGKVYSIQLQMYVIKFVSDLLQVIGFLWVPRFP
jgi:hypothetical protein